MKRFLLPLMLAAAVSPTFGQTVRGRVTGSGDSPVALANVVALTAADTAFVSGAVTDSLGCFALNSTPEADFLRVTCVGYADTLLTVSPDMGQIRLRPVARLVGEVTVTGHRPQHVLTAEGLTTNVEGTLLSKAGTAEDVLRRVPSLSKSGGRWNVFGRGTAIIYLNGHRLHDLSELDNMRSADIRDVEVVRNPGAKYAASVAAVIRIRTVRRRGDGFSLDARSSYYRSLDNDVIEQVNTNYRHNSLNLFAMYKFADSHTRQDADMGQEVRGDTLWEQTSHDRERGHYQQHTLRGGFCYDFPGNHSIGAQYTALLYGHQTFKTNYDSQVLADGVLYDNLATVMLPTFDNKPTHRANAYYTGHVGKTSIDLNGDMYFSDARTYETTTEQSAEHDSRSLVSESRANNAMGAVKLALSSPLFGGTLDYGAEYIHTTSENIYLVDRTDILPSTESKIRETTAAPYAEYRHQTPLGALRAGLRYEFVCFRYYDAGVYVPGQSRTFRNVFPSLSLNTKIGATQCQLSYSAKTRRPAYSQLRANISYANRFLRQTGNPNLFNETDHTVSLSALWRTFQFSADYKDARDAIIYCLDQQPGNESVTVIGYRNEPSIKTLSAQIVAFPTFGFYHPQFAAGIIKQWLTLDTNAGPLRFNAPICYVQLNNALSLPWGVTANADFTFTSKGDSENAHISAAQYLLNVGLSKSLLHDAFTVELKGYDLLFRANEYRDIYGVQARLWQHASHDTRNVSLTVRYKLNTTRSKYRGKEAGASAVSRM